MNNFCFKLAKFYDVKYLQSTSIFKGGKYKKGHVEIELKQVMFYKSTPSFYVFYANNKYIKIKKDNVLSLNEY